MIATTSHRSPYQLRALLQGSRPKGTQPNSTPYGKMVLAPNTDGITPFIPSPLHSLQRQMAFAQAFFETDNIGRHLLGYNKKRLEVFCKKIAGMLPNYDSTKSMAEQKDVEFMRIFIFAVDTLNNRASHIGGKFSNIGFSDTDVLTARTQDVTTRYHQLIKQYDTQQTTMLNTGTRYYFSHTHEFDVTFAGQALLQHGLQKPLHKIKEGDISNFHVVFAPSHPLDESQKISALSFALAKELAEKTEDPIQKNYSYLIARQFFDTILRRKNPKENNDTYYIDDMINKLQENGMDPESPYIKTLSSLKENPNTELSISNETKKAAQEFSSNIVKYDTIKAHIKRMKDGHGIDIERFMASSGLDGGVEETSKDWQDDYVRRFLKAVTLTQGPRMKEIDNGKREQDYTLPSMGNMFDKILTSVFPNPIPDTLLESFYSEFSKEGMSDKEALRGLIEKIQSNRQAFFTRYQDIIGDKNLFDLSGKIQALKKKKADNRELSDEDRKELEEQLSKSSQEFSAQKLKFLLKGVTFSDDERKMLAKLGKPAGVDVTKVLAQSTYNILRNTGGAGYSATIIVDIMHDYKNGLFHRKNGTLNFNELHLGVLNALYHVAGQRQHAPDAESLLAARHCLIEIAKKESLEEDKSPIWLQDILKMPVVTNNAETLSRESKEAFQSFFEGIVLNSRYYSTNSEYKKKLASFRTLEQLRAFQKSKKPFELDPWEQGIPIEQNVVMQGSRNYTGKTGQPDSIINFSELALYLHSMEELQGHSSVDKINRAHFMATILLNGRKPDGSDELGRSYNCPTRTILHQIINSKQRGELETEPKLLASVSQYIDKRTADCRMTNLFFGMLLKHAGLEVKLLNVKALKSQETNGNILSKHAPEDHTLVVWKNEKGEIIVLDSFFSEYHGYKFDDLYNGLNRTPLEAQKDRDASSLNLEADEAYPAPLKIVKVKSPSLSPRGSEIGYPTARPEPLKIVKVKSPSLSPRGSEIGYPTARPEPLNIVKLNSQTSLVPPYKASEGYSVTPTTQRYKDPKQDSNLKLFHIYEEDMGGKCGLPERLQVTEHNLSIILTVLGYPEYMKLKLL